MLEPYIGVVELLYFEMVMKVAFNFILTKKSC